MMKKILVLLGAIFLSITFLNAATAPGKIVGGAQHSMPSWFKLSFLDMTADAQEAAQKNKHLMLFLDLDGCPYCAKMLHDSFFPKNRTSDFIKAHFDVVQIRITGDREVTWDDNTVMSEKEFAKKMKVYFTPTILFLDGDKNIVARVDGYRSPENFLDVLKYVNGKYYKKMELDAFLEKVKNKNLYKLKPNKLFSNITDLSKISTPLAVILEDGSCTQCEYLHNVTFKNKDVAKELKKYTIVRLDTSSDKPIIDVNGHKTTPKQLALKMNLTYRPTILLYNEKKLQLKIDALLYSFHLKERLRYVSGEYYKKYKTYSEYSHMRKNKLLKEGVTIDLSN
ncbi:MAG: thioredoxin fold domain-containing protein [Sulfurospirillaceae bacterium]|nr:thioredoxin fold domain-containing protein [Sulfurospirillaceae bacterium]